MITKHKLYKIALVSITMVLMLVSTVGAVRFGDVILETDPTTQSVDFLKFPTGECDWGCGSFITGACAKETQKVVPEKGTIILFQVPDVRQSTDYSCGVSCFQAVIRYWGGEDLREDQLIKFLNTTPERGTYFTDLVQGAEKMGFRAEMRENLTLDDLKKSIEKGVPVIVNTQAWKLENQSWETDENGHYMVAIGVDNKNVYLEDPSILGSRGYIPHDEFIERWHDYGYDPTKGKNRRFIRMGIFIRGDKPGENPEFIHVD